MKYFKTFEGYKRGVNGVGSLKNTLAVLKKENILRYPSPEDLAMAIHKNYEAITGEKYEDAVQMSMDDVIADTVAHFKMDGPDFMAAWDRVIKESYDGTLSDIKYDIEMALDNLGINSKALKAVKKVGKGYEVRMSSYMSDKNTWDRIGTDIGADLVDFKKGSINVGIYEAKNKKVDKNMWNKMSDEKRFDALLSVVKDPDDAEKYIDSKWEDLPSGFERDMTLYEGRINRKQADDYGKKLKKAVPSVNWAKVAKHDGEIKLFIDYSKFADRAQLRKAGEELGLTYRSDGRVSNRPGLDFKRGDSMVGGGGVLGIGNNWMVFVKE